jgi:hypothetical protein
LLSRLALRIRLALLTALLAALSALAALLARALALLLALLAALSLLAALARTIRFISHGKSPVWWIVGFSPPGKNLPDQDWFRVLNPKMVRDEAGILLQGVARFSRKIVSTRQFVARGTQGNWEWGT